MKPGSIKLTRILSNHRSTSVIAAPSTLGARSGAIVTTVPSGKIHAGGAGWPGGFDNTSGRAATRALRNGS